jgi:hypothetical protein
VPHAPPSTTAPHARTWPSVLEVVSAPTALTLVLHVTAPVPALPASAVSTTSREPARPPALLEPDPSTASANAPQVSSLSDSASPVAAQDSPPSPAAASPATPTVLNAQVISTAAPLASMDSTLTPAQEDVSLKPAAPTVKISSKESAPASASPDTSSTRASASTVAASMATLPTPSADA